MEKKHLLFVRKAKKELDGKLSTVDSLTPIAREAKISADRGIAFLHSGREKEALLLIRKSGEGVSILISAIGKDPTIKTASIQISLAFQEYSEAVILLEVLKGREIPAVDVPFEEYVLGMADAAGEINRAYLEARIKNNGRLARTCLERVREISEALSEIDYPDFIIPSFRQKKDFVRRIFESMLSSEARGNQSSGRKKR